MRLAVEREKGQFRSQKKEKQRRTDLILAIPKGEVQRHRLTEHALSNTDEEAADVEGSRRRRRCLTGSRDGPDQRSASDGGRRKNGLGEKGAGNGEGDVGNAEGTMRVSQLERGKRRNRRDEQEHGESDRVVGVAATKNVLRETHQPVEIEG
jgi:hypothetical protein